MTILEGPSSYSYDAMLADAQRREAGLPPDPEPIRRTLHNLDHESGVNDKMLLGALESPQISPDLKVEVIDNLFNAVFTKNDQGKYHAKRVSRFLGTAVSLMEKEATPEAVKLVFQERLNPDLLEDIALASSKDRWKAKHAEKALHAYCTFQTIESKYGEEQAGEIYRRLAQDMIYAKALDKYMGLGSDDPKNKENSGTIVFLPGSGAEMAQITAQTAARETAKEFDGRIILAPYYRDHALTTKPGDPDASDQRDPDDDLMSMKESFAELFRREGSPNAAGIELAVKGKINSHGEISIIHGKPNIGGHVAPGAGVARAQRQREIIDQGITYNGPQRHGKFREIQLENTHSAVLISLGDGAFPHLDKTIDLAVSDRIPAIFYVQNNNVAIGVELDEVTAQPKLWKKGKGRELPGIRVEADNPDAHFLAMRFATIRALHDAGPLMIEAMTRRRLPHSTQHGDHLTTKYLQQVQACLNKEVKLSQNPQAVEALLAKITPGPTQRDTQPQLFARVEQVLDQGVLSEETTKNLQTVLHDMQDPVMSALEIWQDKGYLCAEEIDTWRKTADKKVRAVAEDVIDNSLQPQGDEAQKHTHAKYPRITFPYKAETVKITPSQAFQRVAAQVLSENPYAVLGGPDVYKGRTLEQGVFVELGGYNRQWDNLLPLVGHIPGKINNMPIMEDLFLKYGMGMALTVNSDHGRQRGLRPVMTSGYADYIRQGFDAFYEGDAMYYTSGGKIIVPLGVIMEIGAVGGGGTKHSGEYMGFAYQTNADICAASDAESAYMLLNYNWRYNPNPWIMGIDKTSFLGRANEQEFMLGTEVIEPGHGRVLKDGKGIQVLSFGKMLNTVKKALEIMPDSPVKEELGIFDLNWIRPFPYEDVMEFLSHGQGPIVIAEEDPFSKGVGAQIHLLLTHENSVFKEILGKRKVLVEGGAEVPAPPTAHLNLMKEVIPDEHEMLRSLLKISRGEYGVFKPLP